MNGLSKKCAVTSGEEAQLADIVETQARSRTSVDIEYRPVC